jgi:hypothetical protein
MSDPGQRLLERPHRPHLVGEAAHRPGELAVEPAGIVERLADERRTDDAAQDLHPLGAAPGREVRPDLADPLDAAGKPHQHQEIVADVDATEGGDDRRLERRLDQHHANVVDAPAHPSSLPLLPLDGGAAEVVAQGPLRRNTGRRMPFCLHPQVAQHSSRTN